jgi:A/G-specific adenine glycosylase
MARKRFIGERLVRILSAPMAAAHRVRALRAWFASHRRDLPWRTQPAGRRESYPTWVAEVMLQQTRAEVVGPYFSRFLAAFPDLAALAAAPEQRVLRAWAGLGYYRRARMLHAAAVCAVRERGGRLPASAAEWAELPGVGPYTAAAIAAQTTNERLAAVDGNVKRLTARVRGLDLPAGARALHAAAEEWAGGLVRASEAPGEMVEALMELGATVCTPRAPRCGECPLAAECVAHAGGNEEAFPRAKPAVAWRAVELVGFVAQRGDGLLLRERVAGWNPGLWEPPTLAARRGESPQSAWQRLECGSARALVEIGAVRHVITRHKIRARVFAAEGWRGGPKAVRAVEVGLTGLARRMLRLLETTTARA